jgi:hypothetical protein
LVRHGKVELIAKARFVLAHRRILVCGSH